LYFDDQISGGACNRESDFRENSSHPRSYHLRQFLLAASSNRKSPHTGVYHWLLLVNQRRCMNPLSREENQGQ